MAPFMQINSCDFVGSYSYEYVELAIAHCRKILVMCGPGIIAAAGLPSFYGPNSLLDKSYKRKGGSVTGSTLFTPEALRDFSRLALMNRIMAEYREKAKATQPTAVHILIDYLFKRGALLRCYTQNVDGLEGKLTPSLLEESTGPAVVQLFGTNDTVFCINCSSRFPAEQFQMEFLTEKDVECPECRPPPGTSSSRREPRLRRRTHKGKLRPNFLLPVERAQTIIDVPTEMDGVPDVLLLIGTAIDTSTNEQVKTLAEFTARAGRRVIYIGSDHPSKDKAGKYTDICLNLDPQIWAAKQLQAFQSESQANTKGSELLDSFFVEPARSFTLRKPLHDFLWSGSPNACSSCYMHHAGAVRPCRICYTSYCMEMPGSPDSVRCVQLGAFAHGEQYQDFGFEDWARRFVCHRCYIPQGGSSYPHLVKLAPFHIVDPDNARKLVLVAFYLTEFRSVTDNMCQQIAYTWAERGWECQVIAISLDDVANRVPVHARLDSDSWTYRTYRVFIMYITHALSSDLTIQTSWGKSLPVDMFLNETALTVKPIIAHAMSVDAVLLCCGHLYHSVAEVVNLQKYITSSFENVVGFLNDQLAPSLLCSFLSWLVVESLGLDLDFGTVLVTQWMKDEIAASHTDLIHFDRRTLPQVYRFAPFQTRPLGRDLPSIIHTCVCETMARSGQKKWKVRHKLRRARNEPPSTDPPSAGIPANRYSITVECSRCLKRRELDTSGTPGTLLTEAGLNYLALPYFQKS